MKYMNCMNHMNYMNYKSIVMELSHFNSLLYNLWPIRGQVETNKVVTK